MTVTTTTRTSRGMASGHVPADHADLFRVYFPFIVNLVHQQGIDRRDAEDVAMTVLTKFIEKDALADFDPEHETEYQGVVRKAVFRTFLSGFVCLYVRHYRDRQNKQITREPFSGDRLVDNAGGKEGSGFSTWFEMHGNHVEAEHEQDAVEGALLRAKVREALSRVPRRNAQDGCDLAALFDEMVRQEDENGHASPTLIGLHFGVSKNTAVTWVKRLRPLVAEILAA